MIDKDIKRVEEALGVRLPAHYVSFLMEFKGYKEAKGYQTGMDRFIYSDADILIEMNQLMGFHSDDKIIQHKLVIGENGGGDFYLIDLKDPDDKNVYFFDHEESIENSYNSKTREWDWPALECYETMGHYKASVEELFGR